MKIRLQEEQPIVYRTLKNCLENHRLSHALLFSGPKGTPRKETALYLAKTLVCEKQDGFACNVCAACRRVDEGTYADVKLLDGSVKSIKKEQILAIQQEFNKTALEGNHKIYILNQAENATPEALNSLLKFLEEPSSSNLTAILIVDELDRLLPTIVSRCQILPFRPLSQENCCQQAQKLGVSLEDSVLLSQFIRDAKMIQEVSELETYQKALGAVRCFLSNLVRMEEALVTLESGYFNQKESIKEILVLFIDILSSILQMAVKKEETPLMWLNQEIEKMNTMGIDFSAWLTILLTTRDKCSRPFNTGLLLDQMILAMKEEDK